MKIQIRDILFNYDRYYIKTIRNEAYKNLKQNPQKKALFEETKYLQRIMNIIIPMDLLNKQKT